MPKLRRKKKSPKRVLALPDLEQTNELGLSRGRNAKAIWQNLVDSHVFTASYQSVQRFVGKLRRSAAPEARACKSRPRPAKERKSYGSGPMVRDPQTGKYRRTWLFVLTRPRSRTAEAYCS
jgi:hypothetical protein